MAPGRASSARVAATIAGFSDPAIETSARTISRSAGSASAAGAEDDRVRGAEHAEQRPAAAPAVGGALDEARDLDQLDQHALDPGHGGNGAERREREVARLDPDVRERLEQR